VPPYTWEREDVADTTPLIAWRLPVMFPIVRLVVFRLVLVALVSVALVAKRLVKIAERAERRLEK
jgi:hypothetical protein